MPREPKLNEWKLAKDKPQAKPLSVADPISIPDAPEPAAAPPGVPPGDPPAPGALEPIPTFWPMGETQFAYLYRQLQGLETAIGGGGGGDIVTTGVTNIFTTNQTIEMTDLTSTVIPLLVDVTNNATGVSYPIRISHSYSGGVGPVGLGVGISLEVESGTEGTKNSIAAFEAQSTVNTAGAMTGEAGINVVVAGDPERVMTFGHQHIRNHFQPEASATHALFELGTDTFSGDADGTYYGARAEAGFTGDFVNFQIGGSSVFRVDEGGQIYIGGVAAGGGDAFIGISNAWSAPQTFVGETTARITDALTTGPPTALTVEHRLSTGAPAVGFGVGIDLWGEDEINTRRIFGRIHTEGKDFTVATIDSDLVFSSVRGGDTTEVMRFTATGRLNIIDEIWQNAVKRRLNRSVAMVLFQGFTPPGTGADTVEVDVPYDPEDGTTSLTWNIRRISWRLATAGGAPSLKVEKSSASTAFSATDVDTLTMGSGDYEVATTAGFDTATLSSGEKLRINVLDLGSGAAGWTVTVLMEQA